MPIDSDWLARIESKLDTILEWQAGTRVLCREHGKDLSDHETRLRQLEQSGAQLRGGWTGAQKIAAVLAFLIPTVIAFVALLMKQ